MPIRSTTPKTNCPDYYDNCLFIFDWSRHWIKAVRLSADANLVRIEPFLKHIRFRRPIDMQFGPDGVVYILEYGETWGVNKDARLSRIEYVRGNRAPVARAQAANNIGKEPLNVSLSSQGTFDKDTADKLSYEWRVLPGGKVFSDQPEAHITFDQRGAYNIQLTVTDPHGATGTDLVAALVGNSYPVVTFNDCVDGGFFDWQKPLTYRLQIEDAEDGSSDDNELEMAARTVTECLFIPGAPPSKLNAANPQDPPGLQLMKKSDCFNCHALDRKVVGPAYLDVAHKYTSDPKTIDPAVALEASAQRVIAGSSGVWDQFPMLPHPHQGHGAPDRAQLPRRR